MNPAGSRCATFGFFVCGGEPFYKVLLGGLLPRPAPDQVTVPHHQEFLSKIENLSQAMADENHREAGVAPLSQIGQQLVRSSRVQGGGWFVQDE